MRLICLATATCLLSPIQIHMVTRLASGDTVVAAAEAALGDGASGKATQLLREAKYFYHHAQVTKQEIMCSHVIEKKKVSLPPLYFSLCAGRFCKSKRRTILYLF